MPNTLEGPLKYFAGRGAGLVDHKDAGVEGRPIFAVIITIDTDVRKYVVLLLDPFPPIPESGRIHRHSPAGDRHKSSAFGKKTQGLFDMASDRLRVFLSR